MLDGRAERASGPCETRGLEQQSPAAVVAIPPHAQHAVIVVGVLYRGVGKQGVAGGAVDLVFGEECRGGVGGGESEWEYQ